MTQEQRESIIFSLECMQSRGEFNGFPEETMNFNECDNDDLEYYDNEWINLDDSED